MKIIRSHVKGSVVHTTACADRSMAAVHLQGIRASLRPTSAQLRCRKSPGIQTRAGRVRAPARSKTLTMAVSRVEKSEAEWKSEVRAMEHDGTSSHQMRPTFLRFHPFGIGTPMDTCTILGGTWWLFFWQKPLLLIEHTLILVSFS